jgi:hypothetical protein
MKKILWAALVAMAPVAADALVVNGDFSVIGATLSNANTGGCNGCLQSQLGTPGKSSWGVFDTLPGWTKLPGGRGIEIQTYGTLSPALPQAPGTTSRYYVELDSDPASGNGLSSNTGMVQDIAGLSAGQYLLSFYYSGRENTAATNRIDYSVANTTVAGTLLSGFAQQSSTTPRSWTEYVLAFVVPTDNTDIRLTFSAAGGADKLGGLLANIRISAVPLPAAAWLLLAGVSGFALFRRRRAA